MTPDSDCMPSIDRQGLAASIAYLRTTYAPADWVFLGMLLLGWLSLIVWSAARLDG
jgi:hypothetical protein